MVAENAQNDLVRHSGYENLKLSKKDLIDFTEKVKMGDPDAAYKLYMHYECVERDRIEAIYWLRTSAGLGLPLAEYMLGIYYLQNDLKNIPQAKLWLKRAENDGFLKAGGILKTLE
jgi:TPR repeat protein